jgi:hypothetical protein
LAPIGSQTSLMRIEPSISFFLSAAALEIWQEDGTIRFPERCCVCDQPATVFLPLTGSASLFRRRKGGLLGHIRVPHCQDHGTGETSKLIMQIGDWGPGAKRVTLDGPSRSFLAETAALNSQGDCVPPWRAFPDYGPESGGWRQGNGELWMSDAWSPFWSGLSDAGRVDYLARWGASPEWRERLLV